MPKPLQTWDGIEVYILQRCKQNSLIIVDRSLGFTLRL